MNCSTPDFPVLHYPTEFAQTQVLWVDDAIQPSHPLLSPSPALNLHQHLCFPKSRLFASGGQSIGACFSISPSSECSGLISFRIDCFDLLAVQGTLKSLLQNHSESINSLVVSLLYGSTLTSVHGYWRNHSVLGVGIHEDVCFRSQYRILRSGWEMLLQKRPWNGMRIFNDPAEYVYTNCKWETSGKMPHTVWKHRCSGTWFT